MGALNKRVLGSLLIIAGLCLAGAGGWLWSHIGTEGRASFATTPNSSTVVFGPDTINRQDRPVRLTVSGKGTVWLGKAVPSDAVAAISGGGHDKITGIDWQGWRLNRTSAGNGTTSDLGRAMVWREVATGESRVSTTVEQSDAPQTFVFASTDGTPLTRAELSVADRGWFSYALWPVVAGGLLALGGIALWWWSLRRGQAVVAVDEIEHDTPGGAVEVPALPGGATAARPRAVPSEEETR